MTYAIAARLFQFEAGPQTEWFYACKEHRDKLDQPPSCFLSIPGQEVKRVRLVDEVPCWFCQEG
jgi:hypothetical protein